MRLIDADTAIEFLTGLGNREYRSEKGTIRDAIKALRHKEYTPTVDAEPVRHGHWVKPMTIGLYSYDIPHCSVCNGIPCGVDSNTNYCPECGAKMDEEEPK